MEDRQVTDHARHAVRSCLHRRQTKTFEPRRHHKRERTLVPASELLVALTADEADAGDALQLACESALANNDQRCGQPCATGYWNCLCQRVNSLARFKRPDIEQVGV